MPFSSVSATESRLFARNLNLSQGLLGDDTGYFQFSTGLFILLHWEAIASTTHERSRSCAKSANRQTRTEREEETAAGLSAASSRDRHERDIAATRHEDLEERKEREREEKSEKVSLFNSPSLPPRLTLSQPNILNKKTE